MSAAVIASKRIPIAGNNSRAQWLRARSAQKSQQYRDCEPGRERAERQPNGQPGAIQQLRQVVPHDAELEDVLHRRAPAPSGLSHFLRGAGHRRLRRLGAADSMGYTTAFRTAFWSA